MTPCVEDTYKQFRKNLVRPHTHNPNTKATGASETSVPINRTTHRHTPLHSRNE
jgi:hypothetical protein